MYVKVGNTEYRSIKGLSFIPETNILSDKVPINQFQVDVMTDSDAIAVGKDIALYDDTDKLYAKYWITFSERSNSQTIRVKAESKLSLLDRSELPGRMYSNYSVASLMQTLFSDLGSGSYELDSSFANATISGYMGHHSKKYRLQLVCFVLGASVIDFGSDKIRIIPADDTETMIPIDHTFWKPKLKYSDYVTAVSVTAYSFTHGTPTTTDEYVKVDDVTYIQTTQEFTLANPDAPVTAKPNVVSVDDVQIINSGNADAILSRMAELYFGRGIVDMDVVNNFDYLPGDQVVFFIDEDTMASGRIASASFKFGLQSRSTLEINPIEMRESATVTLKYIWQGSTIRINSYRFPVGYNYAIETQYIDLQADHHRYILRPTVAEATGTVSSDGNVVEIQCELAVDYYQSILTIYNVDAADVDADELDITESATGLTVAASAKNTVDMNDENYVTTINEVDDDTE